MDQQKHSIIGYIICSSSDFFKNCLREEGEYSGGMITMSDVKDEDYELMVELLKACYHLKPDIPSDRTRIVPMILLAQKYQFNSLLPTLISHLEKNIDMETNFLQCLHLDLDSDEVGQGEIGIGITEFVL